MQTMITRFFFDISEPILEWGGEVHRYVGDQVVVTWPLAEGVDEARYVNCYFAILDSVRAKARTYARDFGTVPQFRAGLHGGPVVASQCGDTKKEIVYFGDTVNTAARIEAACREFDRPFLVSGELMARLALPAGLAAESVGHVRLRGRDVDTELFAVAKA
jgi:class 3 adenylate cyclase